MIAMPFAALGTLFISLFILATGINVARARARYGVVAPAVTGHQMFERAFRVQMNTVEQVGVILPSLWLFAVYASDVGAGIGALVWLIGRTVYAVSYQRDPASRSLGFAISMFAATVLWLGALGGVVAYLFRH